MLAAEKILSVLPERGYACERSEMRPETRYARSGPVSIAYQIVGEGETDLVLAFPSSSHLDLLWDNPSAARFIRRLGAFARVILFDRRGVGLSIPLTARPRWSSEWMTCAR